MADLVDIQAADSVKIVGSDSGGSEQTPVQSTTGGALHVNLRNNAGVEILPATETTLSALSATQTNGTQRVQLVDSSNAKIDTISSGAGLNAINVAMTATNYVLSTTNTTTAQLAASATFTGSIETVFNQQTASILLTTDQPGTLTLNQYIDVGGTRRTNQWVYSIAANVPFSRSFTVNGNFFNLSFQNTGVVATTTLNINAAYGTLPSATNLGNMNVSLDEINGVAFSLRNSAIPVTMIDGYKATYSAAAASVVSAATPTDIFTLTGSASKTIRVTKLGISGTQTTGASRTVNLIKRSTANTGGTSTNLTEVAYDSASPASTATALAYTANPTLGTTIGTIISAFIPFATPTGGLNAFVSESLQIFEFGTSSAQSVVLRGTNEVLSVNLNGVTSVGGSFDFFIEWTEE